MSGNCSICLGALEDPVCTPCGHVYCTTCLANHVNHSTTDDQITTTCPTCRCPFYTVTPDLTYLPRQYHKYVVPAVRRVFVDTSAIVSLQRKLRKAETRIKNLENDQEILSNEYQRHAAEVQAYAAGQHNAVRQLNRLSMTLAEVSQHAKQTESQRAALEIQLEKSLDWGRYWKSKYRESRQNIQDAEERDDTETKRKSVKSDSCSKRTPLAEASGSNAIAQGFPPAGREIKPIPRRSSRLMSAHHHSSLGSRSSSSLSSTR